MKKTLIILAVIIIVGAGIVYYFMSGFQQDKKNDGGLNIKTVEVQSQITLNIDAKKWQFLPKIINIKKGQRIKIIINNIDGNHGIYLPEFNVSDINSIEFTANKKILAEIVTGIERMPLRSWQEMDCPLNPVSDTSDTQIYSFELSEEHCYFKNTEKSSLAITWNPTDHTGVVNYSSR